MTFWSHENGNPYCYHGNRKILLPWGVQLHHIFYSVSYKSLNIICVVFKVLYSIINYN